MNENDARVERHDYLLKSSYRNYDPAHFDEKAPWVSPRTIGRGLLYWSVIGLAGWVALSGFFLLLYWLVMTICSGPDGF